LISAKSFQIISKIPFILASIGIYYFSSLPQPPFVLTSFQWQDKVLHLIAYLSYGITIAIAIHSHQSFSLSKKVMIILMLGMIYALSDEFHQSFVPGRTSEIGDILADWIGITISAIIYRRILISTESK